MKFTVNLGTSSYDVVLKRGCLKNACQFIHMARKAVVITDDGIPEIYAKILADQCTECRIITVPQGQASKTLTTVETILTQMLDFGLGKEGLVIAVGGGTVGNLAGFAASMYMQGVDFINCPTTTLAMTNRAIGGTVSVDLDRTRNIVGAPYRPRLVLVDPDVLATLPRRHFVNGLAEALKMALCLDPVLFQLLENGDVDAEIETIVQRCLTAQRNLAEQEQYQPGASLPLRFGHTLGDGIEAVKGNWGRRTTGLYHGECVALGMLPMIQNKALQKRTRAVMRRLGLPIRCNYDKAAVKQAILRQHAVRQEQFMLVHVPGLGCWQAELGSDEALNALLG